MKTTAVLDLRTLRRMAGSRSFERGEDYVANGRVGALAEHEGTITTKVQGSRSYRVKLWIEDGEVGYSCTCPVGNDGAFCKHCVAVGLAWLDQGRPDKTPSKKASRAAVTMDDIREYLLGQDQKALVDLIMDRAMDDDRLRRQLLMKTAKNRSKGLDLTTYRQAIDAAINPGEFVGYGDMYDYTRGIEEAINSIEELLREEHAAEVIELAEHALTAAEDAIGS